VGAGPLQGINECNGDITTAIRLQCQFWKSLSRRDLIHAALTMAPSWAQYRSHVCGEPLPSQSFFPLGSGFPKPYRVFPNEAQ
jgi:hypothetical protein